MHRLTNEWLALGWTQLWQVALLATAVLVVTRLFARHRPHVAYLLWMLVILKGLTPPIWASPVGLFSLAQSPHGAVPAAPDRETVSDGFEAPPQVVESPIAPHQASAATNRIESDSADGAYPAASFEVTSIAVQALAGIWLAGFLAVSAAIVWKWVAFRRHIRQMGSAASAEIEQQMQNLAERLSVRSVPRAVVIEEPAVPAVFGILRPKLLLPQSLLSQGRELDLDPILAHELVHIRRHDAVASALQLIAQALWWFHPLIWWANREARHERERCCDEAVVAGLGCPPIRYAATLVAVAELAVRARRIPAVAMIGPRETTARRLEHITRRSQQFRKRTPLASLVAVVLLGAAVLPGAALVPGTAGLPAAEPAQKPASSNTTIAIAGVCLDSNERPLSGVDVYLVQRLPPDNRFKRRTVRTAADGRFRFDGIPAPYHNEDGWLDYTVIARKPGLSTAISFVDHESKPDDLSLKLGPPASLKGQVTDREGKPLAGAMVWMPYVDPPIPGVLSGRTDARGRYEIDDLNAGKNLEKRDPKTGKIIGYLNPFFRLARPGYASTHIFYHGIPDMVDVVLAREAVIEGRVVDSLTGKPAANVRVSCQGIQESESAHVTTDDQGRYRIGGLVVDAYNVRPDVADRTAVAIDSLVVHPGEISHAPDLKLVNGGFLDGQLVDASTARRFRRTRWVVTSTSGYTARLFRKAVRPCKVSSSMRMESFGSASHRE